MLKLVYKEQLQSWKFYQNSDFDNKTQIFF